MDARPVAKPLFFRAVPGIGLRLVGEGGASLALPRRLELGAGLWGLDARGEGGIEREDGTRERLVLGGLD